MENHSLIACHHAGVSATAACTRRRPVISSTSGCVGGLRAPCIKLDRGEEMKNRSGIGPPYPGWCLCIFPADQTSRYLAEAARLSALDHLPDR